MTEPIDERVESRAADLLPEERVVGSDNPEAQASAILAESDGREAHPELAAEHRTSEETV
jgi:hypothetical protein